MIADFPWGRWLIVRMGLIAATKRRLGLRVRSWMSSNSSVAREVMLEPGKSTNGEVASGIADQGLGGETDV